MLFCRTELKESVTGTIRYFKSDERTDKVICRGRFALKNHGIISLFLSYIIYLQAYVQLTKTMVAYFTSWHGPSWTLPWSWSPRCTGWWSRRDSRGRDQLYRQQSPLHRRSCPKPNKANFRLSKIQNTIEITQICIKRCSTPSMSVVHLDYLAQPIINSIHVSGPS